MEPPIHHHPDSIKAFLGLLQSSSENLLDAARMLARLVARDPDAREKIREEMPVLSRGFLANLLRVGEGTLHPGLLYGGAAAYSRLRRLPISAQTSILKAGSVELVIDAQSGDTMRVQLADLGPGQIQQALSLDGPRSRDEQRAWLRQATKNKNRAGAANSSPPYFVKGGALIVREPCELTRRQLLNILAEMG